MPINVSNLIVTGKPEQKVTPGNGVLEGVANLVVVNKQPKRKVFHRDEKVDSVVERFYKDSPYVRDMINN